LKKDGKDPRGSSPASLIEEIQRSSEGSKACEMMKRDDFSCLHLGSIVLKI